MRKNKREHFEVFIDNFIKIIVNITQCSEYGSGFTKPSGSGTRFWLNRYETVGRVPYFTFLVMPYGSCCGGGVGVLEWVVERMELDERRGIVVAPPSCGCGYTIPT